MDSLEDEELDYELEVSSNNLDKEYPTNIPVSSMHAEEVECYDPGISSQSLSKDTFRTTFNYEINRVDSGLEGSGNSNIAFEKPSDTQLTNTDSLGSTYLPLTSTALFEHDTGKQTKPKVMFDLSSLFAVTDSNVAHEIESALPESHVSERQFSISPAIHSELTAPDAVCNYSNSPKPDKLPRSILRRSENRSTPNSEAVEECLGILCHIPPLSQLLQSAKEVFNNVCFNELFQGECLNSSCFEDHYSIPDSICFHPSTLWYASLYIICHSTKPKIAIVKKLVQFFSDKGDLTKTLLFSKCICKLGDTEKLPFAQYLVNSMMGPVERTDAITRVLILSYADLESEMFNSIMEGLGVFEYNSTQYNELIRFLSFRSHNFHYKLLMKLMVQAIEYYPTPNLSGITVNLDKSLNQLPLQIFRQLPPKEVEKIEATVTQFINHFCIDSSTYNSTKNLQIDSLQAKFHNLEVESIQNHSVNESHSIKSTKKVRFVDVVNVVQFLDPDISEVADDAIHDVLGDMNDPIDISDHELPTMNGSTNKLYNLSCIMHVMENSCPDWILNSECKKAGCILLHRFEKTFFDNKPVEKVLIAAEFVIANAVRPSFEILEGLVDFFNSTNSVWILTYFRKCASKLTLTDSWKLTTLVLSRLARHFERWEAIEMVLAPRAVDFGKTLVDTFLFDKHLLNSVLVEAIYKKSYLPRWTTNEILRRVSQLPSPEREDMLETTTAFVLKFILKRGDIQSCPELVPTNELQIVNFNSQFKTELHRGVSNKYFTVCVLLKHACERGMKETAIDSLCTFLLINYARARILNELLENCKFFNTRARHVTTELLGQIGLSVGIRLFEHDNYIGASEVFEVLRTFKFDFLEIEPVFFHISRLNLALIYCSVTVQNEPNTSLVEVFLENCVQPFLDSDDLISSIPNELMVVTNKMFKILSDGLFAEQTLALYNGIYSRQKSLLFPLNIFQFQEITLRSALSVPCGRDVRLSCLKLFLDVVCSANQRTHLQKVTLRSVLLVGLKEIHFRYKKFRSKGLPNLLHPLIKKLLISCIKVSAYPEFHSTCDQISLYSSMSVDEIKIYLFWWIYYLLRTRKRHLVDYFEPVTLTILQDNIEDELRLPIPFNLQNVDCHIAACAERVVAVLKALISEPLPAAAFKCKFRGTYVLDQELVRAISQQVLNCLLLYNSEGNSTSVRWLCTFSFDESHFAFH